MKRVQRIIFLILAASSLPVLCQEEDKIIFQGGHAGRIEVLEFSPGRNLLASTSGLDHVVKIWDTKNKILIRNFTGHDREIESLHFSQNGKFIAACTARNAVIWSIETGEKVRDIAIIGGKIVGAFLSPDGSQVTLAQSGNIQTWSKGSSDPISKWQAQDYKEKALTLTPAGSAILYRNDENKGREIRLLDIASGKIEAVVRGIQTGVSIVELSRDESHLAAYLKGNSIKVWNLNTGDLILNKKDMGDNAESLDFSPNSTQLAIARRKEVEIIQISGAFSRRILGREAAAFLHVDDMVAIPDKDGLKIHNIYSRAHSVLGTPVSSILELDISPDGKYFVTGHADKTVRLWEISSGKLIRTMIRHTASVFEVEFSPDGSLIASAGVDRSVQLWNTSTGKIVRTLEPPRTNEGNVTWIRSLSYSPSGDLLAAVSYAQIRIYHVSSGKKVRVIESEITEPPPPNGLSSIPDHVPGSFLKYMSDGGHFLRASFSPDSKVLAISRFNSGIAMFNVDNWTITEHDTEGDVFEFSPDGALLAVAEHRKIVLVDAITGSLVWEIQTRQGSSAIAFSDDGSLLASGGDDGIIRIWEPYSGRSVASIADGIAPIRYLRFLPSSKTILSASLDGAIRYWRISDGYNFATIYCIENGGYLTYTPENYFASSSNDQRRAHFREMNQKTTLRPPDRNSHNPEAVADFIASNVNTAEAEMTFDAPIPADILNVRKFRFNGKEVEIESVNPERRTIRLLGGILPNWGMNRIEILNALEEKKRELRFWYNEKLLKSVDFYDNSFAIVAAIDNYGPDTTGFAKLGRMKQQAKELQEVLRSTGFPEENILMLLDTQVTAASLTKELKRFWEGGDRDHADRVFFYFGGHGSTANGVGFLVTSEYDPEMPTQDRFFMSRIYHEHFSQIKANHLMVAIDSCSSGLAIPGGIMGKIDTSADNLYVQRIRQFASILSNTSSPSRNLLVAGTEDQPALYDSGGVFTRALINGLNGAADLYQDGIIEFDELSIFVSKEVRSNAAYAAGRLQNPRGFIADAFGEGQIMFYVPSR